MAQTTFLLLLLSTLMAATSAYLFPIKRFVDEFSTTTPYPTTPPHGCITDDGRRLRPGETSTLNCQFCSCEGPNRLSCYYYDCLSPMCVDAVQTMVGCPCYKCPNGNNCKIPATGEVIPAGAPVERDGMVCSCPPQDHGLPGTWEERNYIARCEALTTLPPTTTT